LNLITAAPNLRQMNTVHASRPATARRHSTLREELVARAGRIIETHGLAALRARELAADAGCSVGAIYNVFTDLDGLILEVSAATLREIDGAMEAVPREPPLRQLLGLAQAYLDYAVSHRRRWDALFSHRMPAGAAERPWFDDLRDAAFSHIEAPLGELCPRLDAPARRELSRSIFAAVHGMVALGLDQRVAALDLPVLRAQIDLVVRAIVHGLEAGL